LNLVTAPKYIREIKGFYILWFDFTNKYIVVNQNVMTLLKIYLKSSNESDFLKRSNKQSNYSRKRSKQYYIELTQLLQECSIKSKDKSLVSSKLIHLQNKITVFYKINDFFIQINYSSEYAKSLVHPQLEHYSYQQNTSTSNNIFDILIEDKTLNLYKNQQLCGSFPQTDFHLLQGQFAMELLCVLNNKNEKDWLGTFHASTISNGHSAIMLIGDSGNGKSTLAALLMTYGFDLIADDFTPMLAKDQKVYSYPAAISIKQGSFKLLEPLITDFNKLPKYFINSRKGYVKYVQSNNYRKQQSLSCRKIVYVNYKKEAQTKLTEVSIDKILSLLITDSWLSPEPKNVEYFLTWLETCTFHKLTYSDADEVIQKFKTIFNEQNID